MSDLSNAFVIGDDNYQSVLAPVVDGHKMSMGLVPRDYGVNPVGSYESTIPFDPAEMKLIPMEEWPERIKETEAKKTRLSDIYDAGNNGQPIPSLDQNGQGYCWFYSGTCAVQMLRAIAGQPYVQLSGHSGACVIKNFRDQGGWGAAGLDFIRERGIVPTSLWPEKSMDRRYNTEENWKAALEFRVTEAWIDLEPPAYSRDLSIQQFGTCLLNRLPVISDYGWWRHSVCAADLVDAYPNRRATDPSRYGTKIKNSWRDSWGMRGWGILKDSRAFPDGATSARVAWGS